jgi:SAM-dependent methyltransferase
MPLRFHEIAEVNHRILNPFTDAKLALLGEVAGVGEGTRVLDLACGKGEMLCTWAAARGAGGIGVDLSPVFLAAARARARELGVDGGVEFIQGDAGAYRAEPAGFDIAACVGATWIGGGLAGTLGLLRPALRPGGRILVGEAWWTEEPPAEAVAALDFQPGEYATLAGTLGRFDASGMELVEMVFADGDSWDRYEAPRWAALTDWLDGHPDDPDHAKIRAFRDGDREAYLRWGRRYLGWGVFVLRPRA